MKSSRDTSSQDQGFSLIELMLALVITLVISGLAFSLLAATLRQKSRSSVETTVLADATQALSWMSTDLMNAGFGLSTNGLNSTDCKKNQIRIRANLNAFLGETTSNLVSDPGEDVIYQLAARTDGGSALLRSDVGDGTTTMVATDVDNADIDGDGIGDGLTFTYLDASGAETSPAAAVRVTVTVRMLLPQVGVPGGDGYQPQRAKVVSIPVILRNAQLNVY